MQKFIIVHRGGKYAVHREHNGDPVGFALRVEDTEEAAQAAIVTLRAAATTDDGEGEDDAAKKSDDFHGNVADDSEPAEVVNLITPAPQSDEERTIGRFPGKSMLTLEAFAKSGGMFKDLGDEKHFLAVYSNAFRDKQQEIMVRAGADRYVARLKAGLVPYPIAVHWHIVKWHDDGTLDRHGGAAYGQVKWLERIENFMVAIGEYYDNENGRAAQKAFKQAAPGQYTMSHGFFPLKKSAGGFILDWNTFEISSLDAGFEANQYTSFAAVKEQLTMPLTQPKKDSVIKLFGAERGSALIADLENVASVSKALEEAGVEFKDKADVTPDTPASNDGAADPALKELYADLVRDAGVLASGLVALQKSDRGFDARLAKIEKYLDEEPTPAGEGAPVDEKAEGKAARDAKKDLKQKQKVEEKAHPYANTFPGAYEGAPSAD